MPVSIGAEYLDLNSLLREIKVRFFVVGAASSRVEPNMSLIYAFPATAYRMQINDNVRYPNGSAHHAFQRTWTIEKAKDPFMLFDACSLDAATEFADIKSWPVFMEIQRLVGSASFCFKQVPIHVMDISGKVHIIGHSDPMRSQDPNNLKAKFKHEVLYPMIESMREDYFTEHVAEAQAVSSQLTQAWFDVFRLAEELGGPAPRNRADGAYASIQRMRAEKPKEHGLAPAVIVQMPNGMQATLCAVKQGPALLKNRAKIHFSFELTDAEASYASLKRLVHAVQQSRLKDDVAAPTPKRRQIILQEQPHGQD